MGKELGYEGPSLQEFVMQQQDEERTERKAEKDKKDKERELERNKLAAEEAKIAAQEKDRRTE